MTLYQIEGMKDLAFNILSHRLTDDTAKPHEIMIEWWFCGQIRRFKIKCPLQRIKLTDEQWESRKIKEL